MLYSAWEEGGGGREGGREGEKGCVVTRSEWGVSVGVMDVLWERQKLVM